MQERERWSTGQRLAEQVQQQLHAQGFAVFRDVSGVMPGTKWAQEIERQLKASKLVVLVVSAKALHSDWVFAEFDMAKEYQIPIIPVFAELLSAPLWLRHLQRLDFSGQPDWSRLMQVVRIHIMPSFEILDDALSVLDFPDEDEDFHDGSISVKLDLARAYLDMGDIEGARSTLEEVMLEGSGD